VNGRVELTPTAIGGRAERYPASATFTISPIVWRERQQRDDRRTPCIGKLQ
jgi:hypothetical protein